MLVRTQAQPGGLLSSAIAKLNSFKTSLDFHTFIHASPPELIAEISNLLSIYPSVKAQYLIPLFRDNGLYHRLDNNYAKMLAAKVNAYRQKAGKPSGAR